MSSQKRHFMNTLYPKMDIWGEEEVLLLALKSLIENLPNVRYSIFQLEWTTTGKIHVQLYIEFEESYRFTKVKKLFTFEGFSTPHVEFRNYSREACKTYCSKVDSRVEGTTPIEIGKWRDSKKSKSHSQLKVCAELIEKGFDELDIAFNRPELYLRFGNRIKDLIFQRKLYKNRQDKRNRLLAETKDNQEEE